MLTTELPQEQQNLHSETPEPDWTDFRLESVVFDETLRKKGGTGMEHSCLTAGRLWVHFLDHEDFSGSQDLGPLAWTGFLWFLL